MDDFQPFSAEPDAPRTKKRAQREDDQQEYEEYEPYGPKSSRFFLGCLVGCLGATGFFVVAIVGLVFAAVYLSRDINTEPRIVRARVHSIARINMPDRFEPVTAVKISFPLLGDLASVAIYSDEPNDGVFLMADVEPMTMLNKTPEEWVRDTQLEIDQSVIESHLSLDDEKTEKFQQMIRGEKVTFKITTGLRKNTKEKRIVVSGMFPGRIGKAFLFLSTDAEAYSIRDAKRLIESIE